MTHVAIVGGGPAGLQAGLLTAKNGLDTVVFDADETAVHHAHLLNYLGVESVDGEEFVASVRSQVDEFDVERVTATVTEVEHSVTDAVASETRDEFVLHTDDGEEYASDTVVLATGRDRSLADQLGCERDADGTVTVDLNMRTSIRNVYAAGWLVRENKIQTAISVGDGAAAALDILSNVKEEPYHDFDTPGDAE